LHRIQIHNNAQQEPPKCRARGNVIDSRHVNNRDAAQSAKSSASANHQKRPHKPPDWHRNMAFGNCERLIGRAGSGSAKYVIWHERKKEKEINVRRDSDPLEIFIKERRKISAERSFHCEQ
jgi:hypothetical protein